MADLYKRLKAIREREAGGSGPGRPRVAQPAGAQPGGAPQAISAIAGVDPAQSLSVQPSPGSPEVRLPAGDSDAVPWTRIAPLVWTRTLHMALPAAFLDTVAPREGFTDDLADLRFLDTETTGLSGGAGTWIFLAGWSRLRCLPTDPPEMGHSGRPATWCLEIRQFFLEDLGGEPDFVAAMSDGLVGAGRLATYNGASFDLPLLRTRWIMNGQQFPDLPHEDCLYPSRRLWRALYGGASLGLIERRVLGIQRIGDIPGALVPGLYLDYLRQGSGEAFAGTLAGVFDHHAQDVASLAMLWLLVEGIRERPLAETWLPVWPGVAGDFEGGYSYGPGLPVAPAERTGISRPAGGLLSPTLALPLPVHARALAALVSEQDRGDWALAAWQSSQHPDWGRLAARAARQAGLGGATPADRLADFRRAADIWLELWRGCQALDALVELLKYLEHRAGPEGRRQALALIREARRHPLSRQPALKTQLDVRQARLMRKLGVSE